MVYTVTGSGVHRQPPVLVYTVGHRWWCTQAVTSSSAHGQSPVVVYTVTGSGVYRHSLVVMYTVGHWWWCTQAVTSSSVHGQSLVVVFMDSHW